MSDLIPQAIEAALSNDWKKAVDINSKILKENTSDIDCLNRLGKAYLELGDNKKAATTFRKALKINRYDQIAQRNLARATQTGPKKTPPNKITSPRTVAVDFLEEPGRTKLIQLINLASTSILLKLNQADPVSLSTRRRTVIASDSSNIYLGALPDDVGHRLAMLMKGGNTYAAFIKSVTKNSLIIFVRETHRAKKFVDTASFAAVNSDYLSFLREEVIAPPSPSTEEETDEGKPLSSRLHEDEETEGNP